MGVCLFIMAFDHLHNPQGHLNRGPAAARQCLCVDIYKYIVTDRHRHYTIMALSNSSCLDFRASHILKHFLYFQVCVHPTRPPSPSSPSKLKGRGSSQLSRLSLPLVSFKVKRVEGALNCIDRLYLPLVSFKVKR